METLAGLVDGEVHDLGDVKPVDTVAQHLLVVAHSVAGLADGLDAVHESHVVDDDALALADGAAAFAVEGEKVHLDLVLFGEELTDVVADIEVGCRGGAEADADVLLADIDDVVGVGVGLTEAFHERAFT